MARLQYSSSPLLRQPRATVPGFSDVILGEEPYRLYAAQLGDLHVEVAQPVDVRDDQAEAAAVAALLPILLLMPVLAIVIALVIRALLQPVRDLSAAVARRDAFTEGPLDSRGLPAELAPLVEEMNKLLEPAARSRATRTRVHRRCGARPAHPSGGPAVAGRCAGRFGDPAERAARLATCAAASSARLACPRNCSSWRAPSPGTAEAGAGTVDLDATLRRGACAL